ncbi:MAG: AAA family ATPase [Sulfuricellaceae bacterium]
MQIESLKLKNFKTFQNANLTDIPRFCVIVGANGTGKSTLFDIFGFLRDCLKHNVRQAIDMRGKYREIVSRGHEDEDIEIEVQFRMPIAGVERLITYRLVIGQDEGKPIVKREILRYKRSAHGSPFHFLDFKCGNGYAIINEEDFNKTEHELSRENQTLDSPDILAIKGLGQFQRFKAASAFRQLIESWHVSDFHISAARGTKDAGYAEHLSVSGDNLPLVAQYLYENHPDRFNRILERMRDRIPGVSHVEAKSTEDGRLILRFQDGAFKDPFIDRYVSDGTIKMFAYLILLYDPQPHPLLCIEEPENQLYPQLMAELAEEFRMYANRGGQVFVSTHSPDFLNAIELGEVFWLTKKDGFTAILRAGDNVQVSQYMREGDQMGYLWKQGFFEGANP